MGQHQVVCCATDLAANRDETLRPKASPMQDGPGDVAGLMIGRGLSMRSHCSSASSGFWSSVALDKSAEQVVGQLGRSAEEVLCQPGVRTETLQDARMARALVDFM